jgi:hypothetical protein
VADYGGLGESRNLASWYFTDCFAEQFCSFGPARAESEGNVVLWNTRFGCDYLGGLFGEFEGIYTFFI